MNSLLTILILAYSGIPFASDLSPYAGQEFGSIKSLTEQEIASLRRGDGMGFAKLAELNHYPGPRHVLDLAAKLQLSPPQLIATESLFDEMHEKAIAIGQQLLAAETRLDQAFAQGSIDSDSLEESLLTIGSLRARLRYVHLEAHLRQKQLLTHEQNRQYDAIRGYRGTYHDHGE